MQPLPTLVGTRLHRTQVDQTRDVLVLVSVGKTLVEDVLLMIHIAKTNHRSSEVVARLHCLQHFTDHGRPHGGAIRNGRVLCRVDEAEHPTFDYSTR